MLRFLAAFLGCCRVAVRWSGCVRRVCWLPVDVELGDWAGQVEPVEEGCDIDQFNPGIHKAQIDEVWRSVRHGAS